ncbi:MAG: ABC transporter permease subunit [Acidobacteria bacterium]|nr:ABC transporter permease subunit [Acidobacteriota bacterium]
MIHVTWSYIASGLVFFLAWPVAFRTTRAKDTLVRAGRGIAAWPDMLWAGMRRSPLFFVSWVLLMLAWQVASYVVPHGTLEHPLVPGWDYVFGDTLFGMSRYWTVRGIDFGLVSFNVEGLAPLPILRGEATWLGAFLAIAYHSGVTLFRLLCGLVLGMALGLLTGLLLPYWPAVRKTAWAPMNFLRMIPLLVAAPWLQLVLGRRFLGITIYIAFGVWIILVVATMNAVSNVPDRYIESARTLGASRLQTYYRVIVPGSIPELRTALLLAMGGSWSLAIVAEFLGFGSGLGHLADAAVSGTNTAQLLIVAFIVALYALTTFFLLNEGFKKLISWVPQRTTGKTDIRKVAGAATGI